jgi:glutamate-1-semialdehyde 2,1-aminomutase
MNFTKNNELLKRARKVTPLGAQTYSKSFRYYIEGEAPTFAERGDGCYITDVDGNRFIDFVCALGPITVGYNNAEINAAISDQLQKGIAFSIQTEAEVLLAEKLTQIISCADMVRFVKNGSDATSAAVRLARAYTEKDLILCSGYHGMQDWYIGSTVNSKGVPKATRELVKSFNYNDLEEITFMVQKYKSNLAAIILEPIQGDGPKDGYLEALRELATQNQVILIFDEVVSGFRYALGGASELYHVDPDLIAFGKGMGNGMPLSAVAGKRELMELIESGVFISTTFGGEALSIAGTLKTIEILEKPGSYEQMRSLGDMMREGLVKLVNQYEVSEYVVVSGLSPHCGLQFEGHGRLNYLDINSIFSNQMTKHGILSVGINNLNLSHTEVEIERFLEAAEQGIIEIKKAIAQDSVDGILGDGRVNPVFKRNITQKVE